MRRSELRENIFKLLFLRVFNPEEEMPAQLQLYFDNLEKLEEKDQQYMEQKYHKIQENLELIDAKINGSARGWKTSRMSKVDLSILRLAVYELLFDDDIPPRVAIDQAVELAKLFGQDESASFINGILATLIKGL